MKNQPRRKAEDIYSEIIALLKKHGPLSSIEINEKTGRKHAEKRHIPAMREKGLIHIARWKASPKSGERRPVFDVGNLPDAPRPTLGAPFFPGEGVKVRRIVFDKEYAEADTYSRKQHSYHSKQKTHVSWLGSL